MPSDTPNSGTPAADGADHEQAPSEESTRTLRNLDLAFPIGALTVVVAYAGLRIAHIEYAPWVLLLGSVAGCLFLSRRPENQLQRVYLVLAWAGVSFASAVLVGNVSADAYDKPWLAILWIALCMTVSLFAIYKAGLYTGTWFRQRGAGLE